MDHLTREQVMAIEHPQEQISLVNPRFSMALAAASVRSRQHLLDLVQQQLRHVIKFDVVCIRLVNQGNQTHEPYLYYSQMNKKHSGIKDIIHPCRDGFFDVTLSSDSPVIWDLEEVSKWPEVPCYAAYLNANRIKSAVGVAIINGNAQIGALFFGFAGSCDFSNQEMELFQETTSHIATALINILEVETTSDAMKEKDQLLALGEAIAAIRDRESFDHVVNQLLKKVIRFNDLVVLTIDRARGTLRPYIIHLEKQNDSKVKYASQQDLETFFLDDGVINYLLLSTGPLTWSKSDMDKWEKIPPYLKLNSKLNVKKVAGVPLIDHKLAVGVIFFFSDDDAAFSESDLLRINAVCRRLSVAILNIAAGEEIQRHQEEKELLLSFSKSLTSVRDRKHFSLILKNELNKLILFDDVALFYLKTCSKCLPPLVIKQTTPALFQPDWYTADSINFTTHDSLITFLQQQKQAVDFDFTLNSEQRDVPDYTEYWRQKGVGKVVAAPLFNGLDMMAVLFFFSSSKQRSVKPHLNLINEIACLISIVAANVNTNEKIIRHFEEISKSKQQLEVENLYLQEEIYTAYNYSEIIGSSNAMKNVFYLVSQVANTNSTVLILGETGTGKELIARALHNTSYRKDKVMVKVNCATLPANLIESELFGHEKGAFTGATERRIGKFELANNSTLFLDEVGELPLELQGKLLRVLQEKEIERIGGKSIIKTDVRIIAATNRDLQKEVQAGNFRSDLYFRLNVFPIVIPPLRERKEDVAPLALHFLIKYAKRGNTGPTHFSGNSMKRMIGYNWPGNVRELEHLIERSVLLANGRAVEQVYLPDSEDEEKPLFNQDIKTIDDVEREHILSILKMTKGKISGIGGAAEMLRIPATTLTSKIRRLRIKKGVY